MSEAKTYTTTKLCGPRVAGIPVEAGKAGTKLDLTPEQAESDLREGAIVEKDGKLSDGFGKKSGKIDALHAGIAEERARFEAVRAGAPPSPAAPVAEAPAEPVAVPPPDAGKTAAKAAATDA